MLGYDEVLHKTPYFSENTVCVCVCVCVFIYLFFAHLTMLSGCSGLGGSNLLCCPITSFSIMYLHHPWESSPPASSQQKENVGKCLWEASNALWTQHMFLPLFFHWWGPCHVAMSNSREAGKCSPALCPKKGRMDFNGPLTRVLCSSE